MNITYGMRQEWLEALFEMYKMNDVEPGRFPEMRATLDAWQRAVRQAPIEGEPPIPPPATGTLDRINAAPSQWAKWLDISDAEAQALIDAKRVTREQKELLNNWWFTNGVKGHRLPDGRYVYFTYDTGSEVANIDTGGADAATVAACGQSIPSPSI